MLSVIGGPISELGVSHCRVEPLIILIVDIVSSGVSLFFDMRWGSSVGCIWGTRVMNTICLGPIIYWWQVYN